MVKLILIFNGSLYKFCSDVLNLFFQVRLIMISLFLMQILILIFKYLEFNLVSLVICIFFQIFKN